jgi:hypothetical protein
MLTVNTGRWDKFGQQGLNDNYLAVWLNNSGINAYYVGKFLNSFGQTNLATPAPPKGWTNSTFVLQLFKTWTVRVLTTSSSFLVDPYIAVSRPSDVF